MDHVEPDDDDPLPFALAAETTAGTPQHLFHKNHASGASLCESIGMLSRDNHTKHFNNTPLPGLVESIMTDGSSVNSAAEPDDTEASTFSLSSLPTVTSGMGSSSLLWQSHSSNRAAAAPQSPLNKSAAAPESPQKIGNDSIRFSQLLRDADDTTTPSNPLRQSRMPLVPEEDVLVVNDDDVAPSGTLISSPQQKIPQHHTRPTASHEDNRHASSSNTPWNWFRSLVTDDDDDHHSGSVLIPVESEPRGLSRSSLVVPLLSPAPGQHSLDTAKAKVQVSMEDDQTFQVSMALTSTTVENVMAIIGNPELLKLWCKPIESLIVTSNSDHNGSRQNDMNEEEQNDEDKVRNNQREYDAEWIEATTSPLEPPSSRGGFLYTFGQSILDALGFSSYGKITMFVERQRGQVGLTIGPFSGGIHASHSIVVMQNDGVVKVVDRVKLTTPEEDEASMFFCGVLNGCMSSCLLPTLGSYMEQVATSMARLRLLVQHGDFDSRMV